MKVSYPHRILAGLLAIWLSGVVLLFCCGNMETKAAAAAANETEFCPLSKSGSGSGSGASSHCNKKSVSAAEAEAETDFAKFQSQSKIFDCCGFLPKIFDKARAAVGGKNQKSSATAAVSLSGVSAPKFSFAFTGFVFDSPKVYQPVVHNRGSTHLKNCVFRI